jgi:hypothetical protein
MRRFVEGSGLNRESDESKEKMADSMIGLSLSTCVKDILKGKVSEEEVKEIMAGTNYESEEEFLSVIEKYAGMDWKRFGNEDGTNEGVEIAKRFYASGKINQSRAEEGKQAFNIAEGRWVEANKWDNFEASQGASENRNLHTEVE